MEATSASEDVQIRTAPGPISRVLMVYRPTGEIVDSLGDTLESDDIVAKAVSIAVAVMSSLGLGGELRRMEVEYSAGRAIVHVDGDLVRVRVEG